MKLIKITFINGIAVAIKILTLLGLNKFLAIYVGPAGYAILGQFQNFVQISTQLASGATNTGVTKYTAEYVDNVSLQHVLWRTAGTTALLGSLVVGGCIIYFNKFLAFKFLKDESYSSIFIFFALSLVFFVFNAMFMAVLNGKQEPKRFVTANISASLVSFVLMLILGLKAGLYGCLISLALTPFVLFFVTITFCSRTAWFRLSYFFGKPSTLVLKNLSKFTLMTMTSALCVPLSQLLIRNYLGGKLGWDAAGCWEAMCRISSAYLMFVTGTLTIYYLPKLSALKYSSEIRQELLNGYKYILPLGMGCSLCIYLCREGVVNLLLSSNFTLVTELFGWQLIGDTIKIASFLLGYVYVAKGYVTLYVFSEILFSFSFFLLVMVMESYFDLKGVAIAYALNYFLHLIFVFFSLRFKKIIL